jgi:hypothetical protein
MAQSESAFQFVHVQPRTLTASSGNSLQLSGDSSKRKRRNSEGNENHANKRQAIAANFQLLPHTGNVYNDLPESFAPSMITPAETYNYPSGPEDKVQRTSPEALPSVQCIQGLLDLFSESIKPQDITPEAFDGNARESGSSILPGTCDGSEKQDPHRDLWEQYFALPAVAYDVDASTF